MPTYEYRCNNCQHEFELFQSMKDAPKRKCPTCGKNTLERLIGTGAAIVFKGSGFYQTDYRSESYKKSAEADKPDTAKPAETKSGEAKPGQTKPADAKPSQGKPADPKPTDHKKTEDRRTSTFHLPKIASKSAAKPTPPKRARRKK